MKAVKDTPPSFIRNALWLYTARGIIYAAPVVTIPILARDLGAETWGHVVFAQVYGTLLSLVIDFGFGWSATREVAQFRHDTEHLRDIVAGVFGARLLLTLITCVIAITLALVAPTLFWRDPVISVGSLLLALANGFSMNWYHQGRERLSVVAFFQATSYLLYVFGIVVFVHGPQDGRIVVFLQVATVAYATCGASTLALRATRWKRPTLDLIARTLVAGRGAFLYRLAVGVQSLGNSFLLGLFTPGETLALFASTDKLTKTIWAALNISSDIIFPRVSHMLHDSLHAAARLNLLSTCLLLTAVCAAVFTVEAFADILIPLLLGKGYAPAIPVFRVLIAALPFTCVTASMGPQWLIPLGRERDLTPITCGSVVLNLLISLPLCREYGAIGMAWAVVISEAATAFAILWVVDMRSLLPLRLACQRADPALLPSVKAPNRSMHE